MEQGAFAPLDLLFNSGRLIYGDYEACAVGRSSCSMTCDG